MKILLFIMLISNAATAKQKYYKWTDEQGNIHYTSEKPEGKKVNEVKVGTIQPKSPQNVDVPDKEEKGMFKEKSNLEKHYERKKIAEKKAQKNKSQCQQAKQAVKKYQQKVRMGRTDKETGERVYLEDSQREEIIQSAKKAVKKYCK
jgi:hypothetical protein